MRTAAKVAEDYINVWNEADSVRRRALLETTWTPTASYFDPVAVGRGLDAIDAIIGSVQRRFPNFSFALSGEADGHGNVVRFPGRLGLSKALPSSKVLILSSVTSTRYVP